MVKFGHLGIEHHKHLARSTLCKLILSLMMGHSPGEVRNLEVSTLLAAGPGLEAIEYLPHFHGYLEFLLRHAL